MKKRVAKWVKERAFRVGDTILVPHHVTKAGRRGNKADAGKLLWHLTPWKQLEDVIAVLQCGADIYGVGNWQHVKGARWRYFNAAMRHISAWWRGQRLDEKTGLPHLAHAVCCLMFLMWFDDEGKR